MFYPRTRTHFSAGSRARPANAGTRNPRGLTRPAQDSSIYRVQTRAVMLWCVPQNLLLVGTGAVSSYVFVWGGRHAGWVCETGGCWQKLWTLTALCSRHAQYLLNFCIDRLNIHMAKPWLRLTKIFLSLWDERRWKTES